MPQSKVINMTPGEPGFEIWFSQNDVGVTRELQLKNKGGGYYEVPAGATVKIAGTKPSGLGFNEEIEYDGHTITVEATSEMTDEAGNIACEITITKSGMRQGSANGRMCIERNPHPEGTTDGTIETLIPELTVLVERVEAAAESVHDLSVEAETLSPGEPATATYDEEENKITFGIPQGIVTIEGTLTFTDTNNDGNVVIAIT